MAKSKFKACVFPEQPLTVISANAIKEIETQWINCPPTQYIYERMYMSARFITCVIEEKSATVYTDTVRELDEKTR